VDGEDVRMIESGRRPCFLFEALQPIGIRRKRRGLPRLRARRCRTGQAGRLLTET
jgi:hypothetical protein